jgi:hypothetical protein
MKNINSFIGIKLRIPDGYERSAFSYWIISNIIKEEDDYIICDLICENTTMPNLTIAKSQIDKWKINT